MEDEAILLAAKTVASSAGVAGTSLVIRADEALVLDYWLLTFGVIGWLIATAPKKELYLGDRLAGLLLGLIFANFGSAGLSELINLKGYGSWNIYIVATFYGYTGTLGVDVLNKMVIAIKSITPANIKAFVLRLMGVS